MRLERPPRRQEREADEVIIVDRTYALQQVRALTLTLNVWRRLLGLPPVVSPNRSDVDANQ